MVKTHSLAWYKNKAKEVFQLYVRVRDANKFGNCKCCTCGKSQHFRKCDGGHFVRSTHSMVCFDERNVHAQCKGCNKWKSGAWEEYSQFIVKKYGADVLQELLAATGKVEFRTVDDYQRMIKDWNDKIVDLKKQKGLE